VGRDDVSGGRPGPAADGHVAAGDCVQTPQRTRVGCANVPVQSHSQS
jgi:hypothetical protein